MKDRRFGWMLVLFLGLCLIPLEVHGQQASRGDLQRFLQSLGTAQASAPAVRVKKPTAQEKTVNCSATCQYGTTPWQVSVTCGGSCTAVDQDCDNGVPGYVQCSDGTRRDCSPCEWCTAWTFCPDNGYIQCQGWSCNSHGHIMCNIMCDGWHYFCPGHFGEELC